MGSTEPSTMVHNRQAPGANDIVVALMGMTGSGKSTLVSLCTDQQVEIGHELHSCTQDVRTHSFRHPNLPSGWIHLVDTPGFDDTHKSDTEVLRTLAAWLTETYSNGVKLSGILYLHRINQPRMQGSALKNLSLFRSLCGDDALRKVVLVTTMWDITEGDIAESREKQLKGTSKYWGGMVAKGSQVIRHNNTQKSAFALFETFMKGDPKIVLKIQSEMVDSQRPLERTNAGNDIKEMLAEQNAQLKRELQGFESELREALRKKDEELAEVMKDLRLEHQQALQEVSTIFEFILLLNLYVLAYSRIFLPLVHFWRFI
ncbi:P-loop containing nucleoside triphosphate hydrolase protein [Xylaria palmicola]|nr:P-loop containing nucleoside triphosphate hydrolase protein [Xylaria palmicola]